MYVSEICGEGIFVTFPWWLKDVKSRSKIALFSNERHFEIWFPKKRTITFFWSKLSKLHKKDPILHVATTFSLKQGETRTSHGPITHPLSAVWKNNMNVCFLYFSFSQEQYNCERQDSVCIPTSKKHPFQKNNVLWAEIYWYWYLGNRSVKQSVSKRSVPECDSDFCLVIIINLYPNLHNSMFY